MSLLELDDAGRHPLEQAPIVGREEHAAAPAEQQPLEPLDGLHVQVIGGLVEQQQIRLGHQCPCQQHPALQAAGEILEARFRVEAETRQDAIDARLHIPAPGGLDAPLNRLQPIETPALAGPRAQAAVLFDERGQRDQALGDHAMGAPGDAFGHVLGQARDAHPRRADDGAGFGPELAGDDPQERGFAGAVTAEQADALAAGDVQGQPFEQRIAAESEVDVAKADELHGCPPGRRTAIR